MGLISGLKGSGSNKKRARRLAWVLANGQQAQAKILQAEQTNALVNNQPIVKFVLEVQPEGGQAFQAEASTIVPLVELSQFQPGATLSVRFDPATPAKVVIE